MATQAKLIDRAAAKRLGAGGRALRKAALA